MVRRAAALAITCAACASVVGVEVTREPGEAPADRDDDVARDGEAGSVDGPGQDGGGPPEIPSDSAVAAACACDASAACCVQAATATCLAAEPGACAGPGSFMLACTRPSIDGRDCCWNQDGGLHATAVAAGCTAGRAACVADADCAPYGGACFTVTCAGVTFGICATSDAAVPPGLACPR